MSFKQLYQNLAISLGLVAALAGSYACGDGSEPNPDEDAQVEVDSGHDKDGGLVDKLVYPDANGDDVSNGDNYQPDTDIKDGGLDASDVNITDVPHYDGGDLTDVLDGGDVGDAGQNLPPVVIIETKDEQGNFKDTFNVGELVKIDASKSYDPDCSDKGTCGLSKGMDYCEWDDGSNGGYIYFPPLGDSMSGGIKYLNPGHKKYEVTCYDIGDNLSGTAIKEIDIK